MKVFFAAFWKKEKYAKAANNVCEIDKMSERDIYNGMPVSEQNETLQDGLT